MSWWEAAPLVKRQPSAGVSAGGKWWEAAPLVEQKRGGLALNTTAGLNDAIYTTLGAPVDLARGAINLGISGINAATGADIGHIPSDTIGGRQWIAESMGELHPVLDPANTEAATTGERIARGVGEGVGFTAAPQVALGGAARAIGGKALEGASRFVGRPTSVGVAGGEAVAGAGAGGGASAAMEVAPDRFDALAATGGGLAGGLAGAVAATAPALGRVARDAASDFIAPLSAGGRQRLAGRQIADAATDPSRVRSVLDEGVDELVPGSQPTTFQATGDLGLGGLERAAAVRRPELFAQRRADQNTARLGALTGIQDKGAPEAVASAVRGHLKRIDDETQAAVDAATRAAQGKASAIGTGASPDASGSAMRQAIEAARSTAKERERALWQAVDPDGTLALSAISARQAAQRVAKELPASAKPMQGEEAAIHAVLGQYGDVVPFRELTALQSRLKAEMRAERLANGESPAYRRMTQLNSAIETDLESAIAGKVAQEARAVAHGAMREEDTLFANLKRQQEAWFAGRSANAQSASGGASAGGIGAGGSTAVSGVRGTVRQAAGGLEPTPGNPRLPGDALQPNFDEAALGRLRQARDATKQRVETFDNKTLGPIRRRPTSTGPYDLPAGTVPERIFNASPSSPEAIRRFRSAVGDEQALPALQDYAVDRLRSFAMNADGTLDPARLTAWRRRHEQALRELPGLDAKLTDATKASEAIAELAATRKLRLDEARKGKLGALLNVDDPTDIVNTVGSIFGRDDSLNQMARVRAAIKGDREAEEGLRKATVDYMLGRFVGNTEVAASGQAGIRADQFQTFIKRNRDALRAAGFNQDEIGRLTAIADDLQRANRSMAGVRIPGGSNTAQDLLAAGDKGMTNLGRLLSVVGAGTGAFISGPLTAMAGVIGGQAVSAMRRAGLETVDDLVADAMLNPNVAAFLLSKTASRPDRGVWKALGTYYGRAARTAATVGADEGLEKRPLEITVTPRK